MQFKKIISNKTYRNDIKLWETQYKILVIKIYKYELFSKKTKYCLFQKNKKQCIYFQNVIELNPIIWTVQEKELFN